MKRLFFVLALLATGCGKPMWSGPVELFPSRPVSAPVNSYVPVYAIVPSGGSLGPKILEKLIVRCTDPSVCATRLLPGERGTEARIAGLKPGESDVVVSYVHPTTKKPGESRFHVSFHAGGETALAVGQVLPPGFPEPEPELLVVRDVPTKAPVLSCHHDHAQPLRFDGAGYTRALKQQALFSCEPPADVAPGQTHLCYSPLMQGRWNWGDRTKDAIHVCASLAGGKIAGLRYYDTGAPLRTVHLGDVGVVDEAQCPTVSGAPAAAPKTSE